MKLRYGCTGCLADSRSTDYMGDGSTCKKKEILFLSFESFVSERIEFGNSSNLIDSKSKRED